VTLFSIAAHCTRRYFYTTPLPPPLLKKEKHKDKNQNNYPNQLLKIKLNEILAGICASKYCSGDVESDS